MNTHVTKLFSVSLLFLVPYLAAAGEPTKSQPSVPAAVEAGVVLTDFAGKQSTIDEFAGGDKWLVVMIWASDCHICNTEVVEYMAFHEAHKDKDASVLGISMDGASRKKEAQDFLDRHLVNFPSLIGEAEAVTKLYAQLTGSFLAGTPAFMIYDPSGELAAKQVGAVPVKIIEEFMAANADMNNRG